MSLRSVLMFCIALVCAAAASFGVYQFIQLEPSEVVVQAEQEEVVVLRVDITRVGTKLTEEMVELVKRPKGAFEGMTISDVSAAVGQSVVIPMFRGEPVMPAKLGKGSGLAALVPEGMLAFTFQAPSESSLLAGFAMPNDRVDILLTREEPNSRGGGKVTQRLVQNVRILAAGDEINRPAGNRVEKVRNVTLAVPPGIDQKLAMAQEIGSLALVLRSSPDNFDHPNDPLYLADLEGAEEPALVDRWDAAFSKLSASAKTAAATIRDVASVTLDKEIKRLTDELEARERELANRDAQLADSERALANAQSTPQLVSVKSKPEKVLPTSVLTIRGNSQSYVTVKPLAKRTN
ncbi:MAG: Flp pilus assembly protein CpaB [Pirellulaceae bacterium]|nr:Flp pilus assembly protein CpaB [Pirellulaceae bacterium]